MKWLLYSALCLSFALMAQEPAPKPKPRPPQPKKTRAQTSPPKIESTVLAPVQTPKPEEPPVEPVDKTQEAAQQINQTVADFRAERSWLITGNYSYIDLLVPSKFGVTVGYVQNAANTYELDYMRGSLGFGWLGIDIGNVTEQRLSLLWRSYAERNSFNFQMGVNYNKFEIRVGDTLLNKITGAKTDYDVIDIQTLGLTWGIGNRWQNQGGFVWSFDWLQLNVPVMTLREHSPFIDATPDKEDREDAQDAVKFVRQIPRLAALKVQLGFSF